MKPNNYTSFQISGNDFSDPQFIKCAICNVPLGIHGTCCGWENASIKCNSQLIIIDTDHPGFGKNINEWKSTFNS